MSVSFDEINIGHDALYVNQKEQIIGLDALGLYVLYMSHEENAARQSR